MRTTQRLATWLFVLLLSSGQVMGREWRWYPKKESPESNVLRPDLEGARDDRGQSGGSDLDEMRQWLYRRDVERRERGFILPDTVEQLESSEGRGRPPPRPAIVPPVPPSPSVGGFEGDASEGRVRNIFPPEFQSDDVAERFDSLEPESSDAVAERPVGRHATSRKHRRRGHSAHGSRSRSGTATKSHSRRRKR